MGDQLGAAVALVEGKLPSVIAEMDRAPHRFWWGPVAASRYLLNTVEFFKADNLEFRHVIFDQLQTVKEAGLDIASPAYHASVDGLSRAIMEPNSRAALTPVLLKRSEVPATEHSRPGTLFGDPACPLVDTDKIR